MAPQDRIRRMTRESFDSTRSVSAKRNSIKRRQQRRQKGR